MPKKNIVIAGGGFAGINALRTLSKVRASFFKDFELILIDRKASFEFLPMLPDVIGGRIAPAALSVDLRKFSAERKCEFVNDEVTGVDFAKRKLRLKNRDALDYEYLLIASGAETNFFNDKNVMANCFKLDSVQDALIIKNQLLERAGQKKNINVVIVGGGYTGIEIATNIDYLLKDKAKHKIYILEKAPDILMMVPDWLRKEVKEELQSLDIEIIFNDSLKGYDGNTVLLESAKNIEDAFCIWAAGVKTSSFIDAMDLKKERTRINVRDDLRIAGDIDDNVFAAGDAGYFLDSRNNSTLRMAVMFAIAEGKMAASNIVNSILKKPLRQYAPVDMGYLIPMAHGKAPGIILGKRVHGIFGFFMHYFMCVYRSEPGNRIKTLKNLLFKDNEKRGNSYGQSRND